MISTVFDGQLKNNIHELIVGMLIFQQNFLEWIEVGEILVWMKVNFVSLKPAFFEVKSLGEIQAVQETALHKNSQAHKF